MNARAGELPAINSSCRGIERRLDENSRRARGENQNVALWDYGDSSRNYICIIVG